MSVTETITTAVPNGHQNGALDGQVKSDSGIAFWTKHCKPVLASLLSAVGSYTPEQQASHIRFISQHVIPNMGAAPSPSRARSLLTPNGSPIEISLNISDNGKPCVRFTFQPDMPENNKLADSPVPRIAAAVPGVDTRWLEQFAQEFFLDDEELAAMALKMPKDTTRIPQCFLAFDLDGGQRQMKAYFYPVMKYIASKKNSDEMSVKLLRRLEPLGAELAPALDFIQSYRSFDEDPPLIQVIGMDCIDPHEGARVKIYFHPHNTFASVRDHVTLGGRINDAATLQGLELLRSMWHLILDEPSPVDDSFSKAVNVPKSGHKGMCMSWEIKPGKQVPESKVYIPLFQYFSSDRAIASRLEEAFRMRGWGWGVEGTYEKMLSDAFGSDTVDDAIETPLLHSYISFNFSEKKGAYMTSYVAPFVRFS